VPALPDGGVDRSGRARRSWSAVERHRSAGLTELFPDLSFDPRIASPDSDPHASPGRALELLHALAPPAGPR
jgi:hypothetical protein